MAHGGPWAHRSHGHRARALQGPEPMGCGARFFESQRILKLLILSRKIFLPLFMLCNHEHTRLPVVFAHDVFPIGFMVLFSISNGATKPCPLSAWLWVGPLS